MLKQLLSTPSHPQQEHYHYLPVSTSLQQQLKKEAQLILMEVDKKKLTQTKHNQEFIPNEDPENIKEDLIMLKLKGYMDRRNLAGRNSQLKKLPSKVQVGRMIEGDPFLSRGKIKQRKQEMSLTDYYLDLDKKESFTNRKFSQIQKTKQRVKKIKKRSLMKKKGGRR